MSLLNFFNLEKRVYSKFRTEAAKAANVQEKEISKIKLLFMYSENKAKVLIYTNRGNFQVIKKLSDFEFSEIVKTKAEEVVKDCYELAVIEAERDYLTEKSENNVYYIDMNKERKKTNFNIF